uniref:Uncharacterized protein n=1 Tax=Glossina austeni TaxID=7395 RepID=A0A1A9UZ96_GLOAU
MSFATQTMVLPFNQHMLMFKLGLEAKGQYVFYAIVMRIHLKDQRFPLPRESKIPPSFAAGAVVRNSWHNYKPNKTKLLVPLMSSNGSQKFAAGPKPETKKNTKVPPSMSRQKMRSNVEQGQRMENVIKGSREQEKILK